MPKILISNIGFGESSQKSLLSLSASSDLVSNIDKVRFNEEKFLENINSTEAIIAGTEKITRKVIESANNLKLIARVGVGVDNIDLEAAKERKISICYTPNAPSVSVPEFTLALLLNLLKGITVSDKRMHQGTWFRPMGKTLYSTKIGIIGTGKIGSKVIKLIKSIEPNCEIFYFDLLEDLDIEGVHKKDIEFIFANADIISIHVPLNKDTYNLVDKKLLTTMKKNSFLINTSRGCIVNENDLFDILSKNQIAGAALDVFEKEPYKGSLCGLENCILTSHIGSMTREVRALMEEQITEDVQRFFSNKKLLRPLNGFEFYG